MLGSRPFRSAALVFLAAWSLACNPFWVEFHVSPKENSDDSIVLTASETSSLLEAVSTIASEFGLESLIDASTIERLDESPQKLSNSPYEVLAYFKRGDATTAYSRVAVHVNRVRQTGAIIVLVSDRDGDSYDVYSKDLVAALEKALSTALPSREIRINRR